MRPSRERRATALEREKGFTLVEALIVVGLVAVIAALAIPAYQDYIVRSKRSAARQVLMEGAQYLERNYTTAGCYDYTNTAACLARSGSATVQPSPLLRAPSEGKQSYVVAWALTGNGQAYTLTATPCGDAGTCPSDAETSFKDPSCGALTITQTGLRGSQSGTLATCWQR